MFSVIAYIICIIIMQVLKAHANLITSTKLSEEIEKLQAAVIDSSPKLQNGEAANSSASEGYSDDIEAEANSYFHQMFSGQLTIEAMVQMLARFKESSVKRYSIENFCLIHVVLCFVLLLLCCKIYLNHRKRDSG